MKIICAYCRKAVDKRTGAVNHARRIGAPLYCDRRCAGLARRSDKTKAEKRHAKRLYDMEYRRKNRAMLKAKKAAYHKRTYDPKKAAEERKKHMARHVEHCRRPEYKAYKREYDRQYRAREFGPFAEVFLLLQDIDREVNARVSDYDARIQNGTLNKKLNRRRDYERSVRDEP